MKENRNNINISLQTGKRRYFFINNSVGDFAQQQLTQKLTDLMGDLSIRDDEDLDIYLFLKNIVDELEKSADEEDLSPSAVSTPL